MSETDIPRAIYHDQLRAAIGLANQAIIAEAQRHPECEGMGTTLSLAVADGRTLHVANAGDSRAYIVNAREIYQVTRDHSLVQEMVDRGELSPDDARHHPRKNVITMALGVYDEVTPDLVCRLLLEKKKTQSLLRPGPADWRLPVDGADAGGL